MRRCVCLRYPGVVARCPAAAKSTSTGKAFPKDVIYSILLTDCYGEGSDEPWACETALSWIALPADLINHLLEGTHNSPFLLVFSKLKAQAFLLRAGSDVLSLVRQKR